MELIERLHRCNTGDHELVEIFRAEGFETEHTVRWCRVCGAVVVDIDIDGRLMEPGGYMKMMAPQVTKTQQIYVED